MRSPIGSRSAMHHVRRALAPTVLLLAGALAPIATLGAQDIITTIAGGGLASDPLHVGIGSPQAVAIGPDGTLYWSATARIMHRKGDGTLEIIAGIGSPATSGDGGPATAGGIAFVSGLAVAANGDLFISDIGRVRKVTAATGVISTVAGGGASSLDGVAATAATLANPQGLAVDAAGDLFIADQNDHRVRRVDAASGLITTVAGNGTAPISGPNGDNGPATGPTLYLPVAVALDTAGDLFISDAGTLSIRRVAASTHVITTLAGTGTIPSTGDGGQATAAAVYPQGIAVAATGDLFFTDRSLFHVRKIAAAGGVITSVAGAGGATYNGDGIAATTANLGNPWGIALDAAGDLFISEVDNSRIRRVDAGTHLISTVAGNGAYGYSGDGALATATQFGQLDGIAYGPSGDLYVADQRDNRIVRIVTATGLVTTVAGTGAAGLSGDGGPATAATLWSPARVVFDHAGNLLITDQANNCIRKVSATTGVITTIAGGGPAAPGAGFSGDGGLATAADLNQPVGLCVAANGDILFTDMGNQRVRRITVDGHISTIAGNSPIAPSGGYNAGGFSGDGGPATAAQFQFPVDVLIDASGSILVADNRNGRVRSIATDGTITTIAGTSATAVTTAVGDGGLATAANLYYPTALLLDPQGNLLVSVGGNDAIRKIDHTSHLISTIAGSEVSGFSGDGGAATSARLSRPITTCFDPAGDLVIADGDNNRVRKVSAAPTTPGGGGGTTPPPSSGSGGHSCGLGGATALLTLALAFLSLRLRQPRGPGARP